jgi:D-alanine transaminase
MKPPKPSTAPQELLWLNGTISPLSQGTISVEDRGFQFADGIYETLRIYNGQPFALDKHLARLQRSCLGIDIPPPADLPALGQQMLDLIAQSAITDGMLYVQITRGPAPRNHAFPAAPALTILFYVRPLPPPPTPATAAPISLYSVPDIRWRKCWVKSIALLPNVLAKNQALAAGADEAAYIENNHVNEVSSANLFAVINGELVTPPAGEKVLPGVTRAVLLELAQSAGIKTTERPLPLTQALAADEIFITSSIREILPVSKWDGRTIGNVGGNVGAKGDSNWPPIAAKLHALLRREINR